MDYRFEFFLGGMFVGALGVFGFLGLLGAFVWAAARDWVRRELGG